VYNWSHTLRNEGIVQLKASARRYVSPKSGIYLIVPVPFSFGDSASRSIPTLYTKLIRSASIDYREQLTSARHELARDTFTLDLQRRVRDSTAEITADDTFLAEAGALFPPFYIGQAINLKTRFVDHATGVNSHVVDDLDQLGLSDCFTVFKWHRCDLRDMDKLERLLIAAHQPILNRNLLF